MYMENMLCTRVQLVELVEKKTKIKCSDDWILSEGLIHGFIVGKSKVGQKPIFEVDDDKFNSWVSEFTIPKNYVSLRKAKDYGISYMTARNAYQNGELEVKTLGFGKERMQYADKNELRRVGARHPKCNIQ